MAALGEGFTLCGLAPGSGGLQGIEPGGGPDRALLTDPGRSVTLYKVSDQKPLGSWTVKQGQRITCPAVCNFETGEYIAVHDSKILRIWKDEDVNLEKVFKATLSEDVYRLHSRPNMEPLVVFKTGAVRFLDALLAAPQQGIEAVISEEEVIRWTEVCLEAEQTVLVLITEKDGDYCLYVQKLNPSSLLKYKLKSEVEKSIPLSFTASLKNKIVTLQALYSSGCVYKSLVSLHQPGTEEEQVLPKSLLLKLPVSSPALERAALAALDDTHIAVLAALPSQNNDTKDCLRVWNTQFQTLQTSKELPQGTSGQLWCYEGKLYVVHGKTLSVIPYQCESSSLSSALGKLKDVSISEAKMVSSVNWNAFLEGGSELKQLQQSSPVKTDSKRSLRSQKSSVAKVEPKKNEQLLEDLKTVSLSCIEQKLQPIFSNMAESNSQITAGQIATILVSRCAVEPTFYPRDALIQLVQTRQLSYSLCPNLMTIALEKTDVRILQRCLQQFPDIPEAVTCACLKTFLSMSNTILQGASIDVGSVVCYIDTAQEDRADAAMEVVQNGFSPIPMGEDSCDVQLVQKPEVTDAKQLCPVNMKRAALLNAVLVSAYSDTFVLPHLKDLSAQQVLLFLQYLQYLYVKCTENVSTTLPGVDVPNVNQIMDWISLLLDAHFTVIVMLPEAKGLLTSLHKFVRAQVKFYSELNKIEGSLQELQKATHRHQPPGQYSIEVLELV
ncbi:nucleolar protein 11 [Microcaecilia unicolor]|uniref:Nucleolar protein 11 n=1 Tax=Microcaecilia unicolor TaxID=1415580 RepID=A0A6P7YMR6_9AMPH|nr:nucleolar protein 11 [Microcaecilia unicolor]